MTKREKQVVSAYTGVLMCLFSDFHEYVEEILGRPVWTHELADHEITKLIKEKSRKEFIRICESEDD